MLESRIPDRCIICRQYWSDLKYLSFDLNCLSGILFFPEVRSFCKPGPVSAVPVPVEEAEGYGGRGGKEDVVHPDSPALVQHLPAPVVVDSEPQLDNVQGYVLVEAVQNNLTERRLVDRT